MSATAGTSLTQQGQQLGERPQFATPYGMTFGGWELVQRYFMRADTPNGLSTDTPTPEANQAFRNAILAGQIVPLNDAAGRMAVSIGGIQNGTMSPFGVPWIDGKPGGMTTDQWNALTASSRQRSDARIAEAQASGMLDGMPTQARQEWEATVRQEDFRNETARMLATAGIRQKDTDLARLEAERQDSVRAGDLDRAQALGIEIDRQLLQRQTLTGYIGGENGISGGQTTLAREQQAFDQQAAIANLRANPRTGLEGWMLGQRGGLNGQTPVGANVGQQTFAAPGSQPNTAGAFAAPGTPVAGGTTGQSGAFGQAQQATDQMTMSGPTGNMAPTTPFVQALMTGAPVANQGAIQTPGRWWNMGELQNSINPAQWRAQDFNRGTQDEQQAALGYASFGGYSDETTQDLLKRNLPRFNAPGGSGLA
jgi:hypothetical protein